MTATATAVMVPGVMLPGRAAGAVPPGAVSAQPSPMRGPGGEMARTGHAAERLWLLGGLSLTAAGVVAVAATRDRRNQ
jgi:hypothetical protein